MKSIKYVSLFMFNLLIWNCYSQQLHMQFAPAIIRAGEPATINFIWSQADSNVDLNESITLNGLRDTGYHWIGPYTATYRGQKYLSDSLQIYIAEALPKDVYGIWVKQVLLGGSLYLVVDEVSEMPDEKTKQKSNAPNKLLDIRDLKIDNSKFSSVLTKWTHTTSWIWKSGLPCIKASYQILILKIDKKSTFDVPYDFTPKLRDYMNVPERMPNIIIE